MSVLKSKLPGSFVGKREQCLLPRQTMNVCNIDYLKTLKLSFNDFLSFDFIYTYSLSKVTSKVKGNEFVKGNVKVGKQKSPHKY